MSYELEKFSAGTMDIGVQIRSMDFQSTLVLAADTANMTQGLEQGLGPRYGMAPIPGQMSTELAASTRLPNMQQSEAVALPATGHGFYGRTKIYGVVPVNVPDPTDITKRIVSYAFIMSTTADSSASLDIALTSTWGGSYENASPDIRDGFGTPCNATSAIFNPSIMNVGIVPLGTTRTTAQRQYLNLATLSQYWVRSASVNVSAGNIPMQWFVGKATAVGDATHAPSLAFERANITGLNSASTFVMAGGIPSYYQMGNFPNGQRSIQVFALTAAGDFNIEYAVKFFPTSSVFQPDRVSSLAQANLLMTGTTATKVSALTTYSDTVSGVVSDPQSFISSSYQAILVAQKRAYACIIQEAYRSENGKFNQWFDLTQQSIAPATVDSSYLVGTNETPKTCFVVWPSFIRGTAMAQNITTGPTLGAANTGVLLANSVYEFTYAVYDKRLNFETNVGQPVKFQTGSADSIGLRLFDPSDYTMPNQYKTQYATSKNVGAWMAFMFSDDTLPRYQSLQNYINFSQYRFYYREEGSFEWLPALQIDAAEFWFRPYTPIYACTGATLGSTGGQPGAFNDYSPLPKDQWIDVQTYMNRTFWVSATQLQFSNYNTIFSYPGRNSIACPTGEFLGLIVHNYPGQAQQSARLIVFGNKTTYVGRFTGQRLEATVQVSPETSAPLPIDGTDFVLDAWTSVTAFSARAATVADGILYWWGPEGIFRDDGVQTPTRISTDLEPNIFTLYDPSDLSNIHATYDNKTKEITWFYKPKVVSAAGEVNATIIYNTLSGNFTFGKMYAQVDWTQSVNVQTNITTAGQRQLAGLRLAGGTGTTDVQRAYYFDQENRSGDLAPTKDFVVKQVEQVIPSVRRLTLASGYNAANFATIAVGDLIALQQTTAYSALTADDMIATVARINTTSGTLDITLPEDAVLTAGTLTIPTYFPIWHKAAASKGLNAIPYRMPTGYWLPNGVNGYYFWLYCYLLAKMNLWKSDVPVGWLLQYRTPTAAGLIGDVIPFADNSDGNFQCYHQLRTGDDNHEGQGIKFVLSGDHIGHEWVLQYLEAHGTPRDGDPLKRFEG